MELAVHEADVAELDAACGLLNRAEAARTGRQTDPAGALEFAGAMAVAVTKPGAHLLLGVLDGQPVAVIYGVPLRNNPSKAQVAMLAVEPAVWGRGIGSQMLEVLTEVLGRQGCIHLRMNVDPANQRARALYERHGWRHVGETEQVDNAEDPELVYRIDLEPPTGAQ